jgi:hypothetical protein
MYLEIILLLLLLLLLLFIFNCNWVDILWQYNSTQNTENGTYIILVKKEKKIGRKKIILKYSDASMKGCAIVHTLKVLLLLLLLGFNYSGLAT